MELNDKIFDRNTLEPPSSFAGLGIQDANDVNLLFENVARPGLCAREPGGTRPPESCGGPNYFDLLAYTPKASDAT